MNIDKTRAHYEAMAAEAAAQTQRVEVLTDRSAVCIARGFHLPTSAGDGPVVFCLDCGVNIWMGATPYTPMPSNEDIWQMARIDPARKAALAGGASHG